MFSIVVAWCYLLGLDDVDNSVKVYLKKCGEVGTRGRE